MVVYYLSPGYNMNNNLNWLVFFRKKSKCTCVVISNECPKGDARSCAEAD